MTTSAQLEDCTICCLPFTTGQRKRIECSGCQEAACSSCVKTYLLGKLQDAHCMFCRAPWHREFVDDVLPSSFRLKAYKQHRENILCQREKSRLPETQALCEAVDERRNKIRAEVDVMETHISDLRRKMLEYTQKTQQEINRNRRAITRHWTLYNSFESVLNGFSDVVDGDDALSLDAKSRAMNFIMHCPVNTCKGLINGKYVCGVCSVIICRRCHVSQGTKEDVNHTCDPDTLASVKHLRLKTKGCPGCGTRISKIDGCDQMWCISCHTAFSWDTGEKVAAHAVVHNPHFYEWRRQHGGLAAGQVDINGCPVYRNNFDSLDRAINNIETLTGKREYSILNAIHMELAHIRNDEMRRDDAERMVDPTRKLRVDYLCGMKNEADWKVELQRHEKRRAKRAESLQVFEMYTATMTDIFQKIARVETLKDLDILREEMASLCHLVAACIQKISQRYGQCVGSRAYARFGTLLDNRPYFQAPLAARH